MNEYCDGFPVVSDLSSARGSLWLAAHDPQTEAPLRRVSCWLGHKAVTVVSLPVNALAALAGTAGAVLSAATLGATKVAVFAATAGNFKLELPTGCSFLLERSIHAAGEAAFSVLEASYDLLDTLSLSRTAVWWSAKKLKLEPYAKAALESIDRIYGEFTQAVTEGFERSSQTEGKFSFSLETPYPLSALNDLTSLTRIDFDAPDRPWKQIFCHYFISIAAVPANTVAAIAASVAAVALVSFFALKVAWNSFGNHNLALPSRFADAVNLSFSGLANASLDCGTDTVDSFIVLYKTAATLRVLNVVTEVWNVIAYIPEALFDT